MDKIRQIEFFIKGLILDPVNNSPVVILQDTAETTVLPIWIGVFEANAIALEMEHIEAPRPMTHDLIRSILSKLSAVLEKVVITDLVDSTYYAELHIRFNNQLQVVDSRPSDAGSTERRQDLGRPEEMARGTLSGGSRSVQDVSLPGLPAAGSTDPSLKDIVTCPAGDLNRQAPRIDLRTACGNRRDKESRICDPALNPAGNRPTPTG